jgi:hypothetical protein
MCRQNIGGVFSRNLCCCGKAYNFTYSECVFVDLVMQQAVHMSCIMLLSVAFPVYNIVPHFLINGKVFEKKNLSEHKKCVLIFSTNLAEIFLTVGRIRQDNIINVRRP